LLADFTYFRTRPDQPNLKAFAKPGIWPYNPALVLSVITRPITSPLVNQPAPSLIESIKTLRTTKSIRRFQADYCKNPTRLKLEKLLRANIEMSTQSALDRQTTKGLIKSLQEEKKSRVHDKKLNILEGEHT